MPLCCQVLHLVGRIEHQFVAEHKYSNFVAGHFTLLQSTFTLESDLQNLISCWIYTASARIRKVSTFVQGLAIGFKSLALIVKTSRVEIIWLGFMKCRAQIDNQRKDTFLFSWIFRKKVYFVFSFGEHGFVSSLQDLCPAIEVTSVINILYGGREEGVSLPSLHLHWYSSNWNVSSHCTCQAISMGSTRQSYTDYFSVHQMQMEQAHNAQYSNSTEVPQIAKYLST